MLVLTRKTNESICIEGGIEVMVVQVRGNRVRLGFRAPADISIQRKERMANLVPQACVAITPGDKLRPVAPVTSRETTSRRIRAR